MSDFQWQVANPPEWIKEGTRLKVRREGEPDVCVIVDKVEPDGASSWKLTVHPEEPNP